MSGTISRLNRPWRASAALLLVAAFAGPAPAHAQPATNFVQEYAVKFECSGPSNIGSSPTVLPGVYATSVSVHNPGKRTTIMRKVAVALNDLPGFISDFRSTTLASDQAVVFGCDVILQQARQTGSIEGFLVIRADLGHDLDVVAFYTAGERGRVAAIHSERVPGRRVAVPIAVRPGGTTQP